MGHPKRREQRIQAAKEPQQLPNITPYRPAGCRTSEVESEQSPLYRRENSPGARAEEALPQSGNFKIQARDAHAFPPAHIRLLLSETQDINLVAAVLGDTPATVYNTYIHYTQDIRKKADGYIEEIFGS